MTRPQGQSGSDTAADATAALDALLRWHVGFALGQPDLITVQNQELGNVPEPARRQIRRKLPDWLHALASKTKRPGFTLVEP